MNALNGSLWMVIVMMMNNDPIRIVVETVPHEVVSRLEASDKQLRAEINGLRNMFSQMMDVLGDLKRDVRQIEKEL